MACKKEKSIDPLKALTEKNTAALRNTEWYGLYRNLGEEALGNNSGFRGYAIAFGIDSTFTFYSAGFTLQGIWSVHGDTTRFSFATGAQNRWTAILNNDTVFTGVTAPVPNNFILDRNIKKISDPPADIVGHRWAENTNPRLSFMTLTDDYIETKEATALRVYYTLPPFKKKIFNATVEALNYSKLIIVDGKIAWMFDRSANNFQYNY